MMTEFLNKIFKHQESDLKCSRCGYKYFVWFPTPRVASTEEMERVKRFALCEYCIFGVLDAH